MEQKTHFQLLQYVRDYKPADDHVTSKEEVERISKHFGLKEMSLMELRNLRDMAVLFFTNISLKQKYEGNREDAIEAVHSMSSVTTIIDMEIFQRGGKV